jgi:threonine/homoserine/homoserine lactone efflux protein
MNLKLNPGAVILGLLGCYGLGMFGIVHLHTDVPKLFFVVGFLGGALLGHVLWGIWRQRKIARCDDDLGAG